MEYENENQQQEQQKRDGRVKLTPELTDALMNAVMKTGSISQAVKLLPVSISDDWIYKRRKTDAELDRRLTLAVMAHRAGNPAEDIEKILALDDALKEHLKNGEVEIICQRDPQTNEILSITEKVKKRFDPRLWTIVHPPKLWSEQAVMTVAANMMQDLATNPTFSDESRRECLDWLTDWLRRAVDELHKQGLPVKTLDALV